MKKLPGMRVLTLYVDEADYEAIRSDARDWDLANGIPVWAIAKWVRQAIAEKLARSRRERSGLPVVARATTGKPSRGGRA